MRGGGASDHCFLSGLSLCVSLIPIEEAHHVLHRQAPGARESTVDMLFREVREIGESIVLIDQHPSRRAARPRKHEPDLHLQPQSPPEQE